MNDILIKCHFHYFFISFFCQLGTNHNWVVGQFFVPSAQLKSKLRCLEISKFRAVSLMQITTALPGEQITFAPSSLRDATLGLLLLRRHFRLGKREKNGLQLQHLHPYPLHQALFRLYFINLVAGDWIRNIEPMTSLEPLRNSQRDFSSSVMLKYIMLQSRGLRANARGVNEVMLRRIAVIKSSVVFNL